MTATRLFTALLATCAITAASGGVAFAQEPEPAPCDPVAGAICGDPTCQDDAGAPAQCSENAPELRLATDLTIAPGDGSSRGLKTECWTSWLGFKHCIVHFQGNTYQCDASVDRKEWTCYRK